MGVTDLDAEAQKVFSSINVAFGVLSNTSKRAEYENVLAAGGAEALRAKEQQAEEQAIKILSAENEFQLGVMALRRNHYRAALESFQKAVELNPEEGEHHAMYAWALWCTSQDKESVAKEVRQSISRALSISPKCVPAYFYRGQVAKQQGKTETAVECFREVLRLDAKHRDAQLELRLLSERGGTKDSGTKGDGKKGSLLDRLKRK
jgi:tetratricopeptide (TPR) repeat protein